MSHDSAGDLKKGLGEVRGKSLRGLQPGLSRASHLDPGPQAAVQSLAVEWNGGGYPLA